MYNQNVRLDNWQEDLFLSIEKTKDYIRKRRRGELFIQKTRKLFCNLLREIPLSRDVDFIQFGNRVQLKSPDVAGFQLCGEKKNNNGLVLAGIINEKDIVKLQKLGDDCAVVGTGMGVACARNVFEIKSIDSLNGNQSNLLFGQEFMLQLVESENQPLYLRSETPSLSGPRGPLQHNSVRLSIKKDCFCKWKTLHLDVEKRFEIGRTPVPPDKRIIICHVMTGLCLAMENSEWYSTIFGFECGISVHTYRDVHKTETMQCRWMFAIQDN